MLKRYKKSWDASLIFSVRRDILIFRLSNLSYNKLEHHHEQAKRFHPDRAPGSNRYYCIVNGDIDARTTAGEEAGQGCCMSGESPPMESHLEDVLR